MNGLRRFERRSKKKEERKRNNPPRHVYTSYRAKTKLKLKKKDERTGCFPQAGAARIKKKDKKKGVWERERDARRVVFREREAASVLAPLLAPFPFNGATIIWVVCIGAIPTGSRCLLGLFEIPSSNNVTWIFLRGRRIYFYFSCVMHLSSFCLRSILFAKTFHVF